MYGYIYLIVNNINGKTYVGKHKLYKKAWNNDNYMGSGKRLKLAQKKYGIENFEKFLITWTYSEEDACEKEKFWISHYKSLGKAEYNETAGGDGLVNPSLATRQKMSLSRKRNPSPNKGKKLTEEWKKNLAESHKGQTPWNKGKKMSDDFIEKCKDRPQNNHLSEVGKNYKGKHWRLVNGKREWYE